MENYYLIEMNNSWNCSECGERQPYEQMGMKEYKGNKIICPDCYL